MLCVPTAIFGGVDIPEVSVSLVTTDEFMIRVTKITSRLVSDELTAYLSDFDLYSTQ